MGLEGLIFLMTIEVFPLLLWKEYLGLLVRKFKQTHRNFIRLIPYCLVGNDIFGDNFLITAQCEACKVSDP